MTCLDKIVMTSLWKTPWTQNLDMTCKKKLIFTKFQMLGVLDRTAISKETPDWRNPPSDPHLFVEWRANNTSKFPTTTCRIFMGCYLQVEFFFIPTLLKLLFALSLYMFKVTEPNIIIFRQRKDQFH